MMIAWEKTFCEGFEILLAPPITPLPPLKGGDASFDAHVGIIARHENRRRRLTPLEGSRGGDTSFDFHVEPYFHMK
ncbi:MAG: hypothetical protein AAB316_08050, partial [Bacteroidota bacterium]